MPLDSVPPPRERVQPDRLHDQLVTVLDYPYSGHDETAALLVGALRAALDVAKRHEHGALRWEDQLPVPGWIPELRQAIADALAGEQRPAAVAVDVPLVLAQAALGEDLARRLYALAKTYDDGAQANRQAIRADMGEAGRAMLGATASAYDEIARTLRDLVETPVDVDERRPRVWQDGDEIPNGTWVLDEDGAVLEVDAGYGANDGELVTMTGFGALVELVLPDYAVEVARATAEAVQAR